MTISPPLPTLYKSSSGNHHPFTQSNQGFFLSFFPSMAKMIIILLLWASYRAWKKAYIYILYYSPVHPKLIVSIFHNHMYRFVWKFWQGDRRERALKVFFLAWTLNAWSSACSLSIYRVPTTHLSFSNLCLHSAQTIHLYLYPCIRLYRKNTLCFYIWINACYLRLQEVAQSAEIMPNKEKATSSNSPHPFFVDMLTKKLERNKDICLHY